jgi:hypothetical protein
MLLLKAVHRVIRNHQNRAAASTDEAATKLSSTWQYATFEKAGQAASERVVAASKPVRYLYKFQNGSINDLSN